MEAPSRLQLTIGSDTSRAQEVQEQIVQLLAELQYSTRDQFGVRLALEEALVNAIKHGNGMDPAKSVRIDCELTPDCVRIEIEDEGPGFQLEDVPDPTADENLERPCGRGILLMRAYMTSVTYNDRGNRVTMIMNRVANSNAPAAETTA